MKFETKSLVKDHREWGCSTRIIQMHRKGWTVEKMMEYIVMPEKYIQEIIDKAAK